jgi:hypothetical protein
MFDFLKRTDKEPGGSAGFFVLSNDRVRDSGAKRRTKGVLRASDMQNVLDRRFQGNASLKVGFRVRCSATTLSREQRIIGSYLGLKTRPTQSRSVGPSISDAVNRFPTDYMAGVRGLEVGNVGFLKSPP